MFTGDEGSFTVSTLPAFSTNTFGFANASSSITETNNPGNPYLGVHALTFDFSTSAGGVIHTPSDALITSPGANDFLTMHLTKNLFPEIIFLSTTSAGVGESTFTQFGIKVEGPGFSHIYSCLGDEGDKPCKPFGFDQVDAFPGGVLAGLGSLPQIDGDYVFSFAPLRLEAEAIPEPRTWALMLLGFAAVGAALRSRARLRTAA